MQAAKRFKAVPFAAGFLAERIARGDLAELEEMHTALALRETALTAHLELLQQLEDDSLGASLYLHPTAGCLKPCETAPAPKGAQKDVHSYFNTMGVGWRRGGAEH